MPHPTRIKKHRARRQRRRRQGGRLFLSWLLVLGMGLIACVVLAGMGTALVGVAAAASFTRDLPDYTEIAALGLDPETFETTRIMALGSDQDGDGSRDWEVIYEVIDPLGGDRRWLTLEQIPADLANATVAVEDKSFWTNEGYDLEGIGRAFYGYVLQGGRIQGGSSITQQLVKNNLITPERRAVGAAVTWDDYRRKMEELALARQVSQAYSKEEILEWYLNTNFYGNLAYGVEAAARVYFDKPAAQLTLPEAAMLAAIPQSPTLNPIDNPEAAKARQELVLEAMLREGLINREQFVAARFTPLTIRSSADPRFDIQAPHFAITVRKELERRFGPETVLRGGLTVYTTLDLEWQRQATCVARAQVGRLSGEIGSGLPVDEAAACPALAFMPTPPASDLGVDREVDNAAVVMLDPRTGEIKAMVGSVDYRNELIDGAFNVAVDGLRQPGSAFKPFTYLTALSQGYSAATMVLDVETDFGTPYNGVAYVPHNYDRRFRGPLSLRQALASSFNVPAVQVMTWVGLENVIRNAHQLGLTTLDGGPNRYGLSLTLGGGEVRLLDMVYAFGVLANNGRMVGQPVAEGAGRLGYRELDPVVILRVENPRGETLYSYSQPEQKEIVTPELAYVLNDILSDNRARCAGFGCPNNLELPDGRPAAVKTGTTNDFRDAWTIGYTPQLVIGVWVGNTDNRPMREVPGSKGAAPIWHGLMNWTLQEEPFEVWSRPARVLEMAVCVPSGLLPNGICPTVNEIFIQGTEPAAVDTMVQAFQVNRETGRLATVDTPPDLIETRTYVLYPEEAADWVRENGIEQPPAEYDTLRSASSREGVAILDPAPFASVRAPVTISGTVDLPALAYYRLAYFPGLTPSALQTIVDNAPRPEPGEPLARWAADDLSGLFTVLLTAVRTDGSFVEVSAPITLDPSPPTAEILAPRSGQTIDPTDEFLLIQARAADDLSLDRVEFFVDGGAEPFAVKRVPPFTARWPIRGTGCRTFVVRAFDAAGNETAGEPVRVCIESQN